jgi:6-phosphogluconate dehydrogenase
VEKSNFRFYYKRNLGSGNVNSVELFCGIRNGRLPANLLQAQRDYFGAHTYERVDKPRGEFFHTNWTGHGGTTASTTYTV